MKLTKEMIDRAALWVRMNGLYPQQCGAPVIIFGTTGQEPAETKEEQQ